MRDIKLVSLSSVCILILSPLLWATPPNPNEPRSASKEGHVYTEADAKEARGSLTSGASSAEEEREANAAQGQDESGWRSAFAAAEGKIKSLEQEISLLDLRMKQLNSERLSTGSPNNDLTLALPLVKQMNDTQDQMTNKKAELEKARKELDDLRTKARRASVPAGWMRDNAPAPPKTLSGRVDQTKDQSNRMELELNELRNKLNTEISDAQRDGIQKQIDKKMTEIEAQKQKLEKLQAEMKRQADTTKADPQVKKDDVNVKDKIQSLAEKIDKLESRRQNLQQTTGYPRYAGFRAGDQSREELDKVSREIDETRAELDKLRRSVSGKGP